MNRLFVFSILLLALQSGCTTKKNTGEKQITSRNPKQVVTKTRLVLENSERTLTKAEQDSIIILELQRRGADVHESREGIVVTLSDILFEFNKADLKVDAKDAVFEIYQVLRKYPERKISVEGHSDSLGTVIYNKKLSSERASTVAGEFIKLGFSERKIQTYGFGESRPIASNKSDYGRARNRRVEVVIK